MASPYIDQHVITKLGAVFAGKTDQFTLMVVVAGELFHTVDRFDWVESCRVVALGVLKRGLYQGGHVCLVIPFWWNAGRRRASSKTKLLMMGINLTGVLPVQRRYNLNWPSRCFTRAKI